jgi:hypothetical protein
LKDADTEAYIEIDSTELIPVLPFSIQANYGLLGPRARALLNPPQKVIIDVNYRYK